MRPHRLRHRIKMKRLKSRIRRHKRAVERAQRAAREAEQLQRAPAGETWPLWLVLIVLACVETCL